VQCSVVKNINSIKDDNNGMSKVWPMKILSSNFGKPLGIVVREQKS